MMQIKLSLAEGTMWRPRILAAWRAAQRWMELLSSQYLRIIMVNQRCFHTRIRRLLRPFNYQHVQGCVKKTSYLSNMHWFTSSDSFQQTRTSVVCCGTVRTMAVAHAALLRLIPVCPDPMEQDSQEDIPHNLLREALSFQTTA